MVRDDETGWVEPDITINGHQLTFPQAMAVRVAVSNFLQYLSDRPSRKLLGERLADGYAANLTMVERFMRDGG